jgi:hypothetical protein
MVIMMMMIRHMCAQLRVIKNNCLNQAFHSVSCRTAPRFEPFAGVAQDTVWLGTIQPALSGDLCLDVPESDFQNGVGVRVQNFLQQHTSWTLWIGIL